MTEDMLISQFQTLEEPENAVIIDINLSVEEIVQEIIKRRAWTIRYIKSD